MKQRFGAFGEASLPSRDGRHRASDQPRRRSDRYRGNRVTKSESAVRPGGIVAVLAFAGIVGAIMQTVVVPIIGELPQLLNTSAGNATWVITATLLAAAVFMPVIGRLGDMYGKKRVLLICCAPLFAGSLLCAVATSLVPMVIGRGLQGVGMGMIPLGISVLRDVLPADKLGSSIALLSASLGIGGGLGLPLSAAVAEYADWRVLFWGAAAATVLIVVLIWKLVPTPPTYAKGQTFDYLGAVALGAGIICLLLSVTKGSQWGWGEPKTIGLLAVGILVLLAWGWWERRHTDPLVDLKVSARPQVLLTNIASVLVGFAMYAQSLAVPQLLQLPEATGYGLGQSMLAMGLWLLPAGLMMMAVSPLGGRLSAARGPKFTLVAGTLVIALGYGVSLALLGTTWGLMVVGMITNAGVGLAYGAMPALIMGSVPRSETGAANSFNTLMRSMGSSAASAVIGVVLSRLTTDFGGHALPSENGFRVTMLIGCGVALLAATIAATIPTRAVAAAEAAEGATGRRHAHA
ncbi:MFS transporter [Actinoplanes subglobosus]|uniref:MFS transporter n=1 Tax=Actinoplanes subglobosus TaxID=1547892 RepID=A0ABV8IXU0_9ACTN